MLVDGSRVGPPRVVLSAPKPQIWTKAHATPIAKAATDPLAARCVADAHADSPHGPAVVRIGVTGLSVTFRTASALRACDGDSRPTPNPSWCGRVLGRVEGGRLRDPRLDLAGCATPRSETVAFAWLEPVPRASYVAVRQPGYTEVYPLVAGLPVRVSTTSNIDVTRSSVRFDVSEHDEHGALLRASTVEARVAG